MAISGVGKRGADYAMLVAMEDIYNSSFTWRLNEHVPCPVRGNRKKHPRSSGSQLCKNRPKTLFELD